jgi:hypothetical protein
MLSIPKIQAAVSCVVSITRAIHNSKYAGSLLTINTITLGRVVCPVSPVDCHGVMAYN